MSLPVGQASARWALAEGAPDALGGGGHRHIGDAARGEGVEEARGVEYVYEQPLTIREGRVRYPDFTIADHARGVTFYWEHLGMLDDPSYQTRWERKRAE